ncbi:MAG: hypothetical protein JWP88_2247 [Flaviaesturariibacter sp.]|nr:hypothetical protein [Flaviaesturariibacter sp.]
MAQTTDRENQKVPDNENPNLPKTDTDQKKTDPNLTELKGFTDSKEKLEPEGTDNPDVKGMP